MSLEASRGVAASNEYCVASGQAFESEENRKPVAKCSLLFIPPWPGVKFTTIGNCSLYQKERVGCPQSFKITFSYSFALNFRVLLLNVHWLFH